jgi:hypothetical protein
MLELLYRIQQYQKQRKEHSSLQQNIVFYRHKKVFNTLKKQKPEPSPINVCQPIPNPPLTTTIQMENLHCLVKK